MRSWNPGAKDKEKNKCKMVVRGEDEVGEQEKCVVFRSATAAIYVHSGRSSVSIIALR